MFTDVHICTIPVYISYTHSLFYINHVLHLLSILSFTYSMFWAFYLLLNWYLEQDIKSIKQLTHLSPTLLIPLSPTPLTCCEVSSCTSCHLKEYCTSNGLTTEMEVISQTAPSSDENNFVVISHLISHFEHLQKWELHSSHPLVWKCKFSPFANTIAVFMVNVQAHHHLHQRVERIKRNLWQNDGIIIKKNPTHQQLPLSSSRRRCTRYRGLLPMN